MILAPLLHNSLISSDKVSDKPLRSEKKSTEEEQKKLEERIKKANQPLGNARGSGFSVDVFLKKIDEVEEEKKNAVFQEELPENDFSEEELQKEWAEFLRGLERENLLIYTAIQSFILTKIEKNQIEITYPSDTARSKFDEIKEEFFGHFKQKVNNFKINLNYKRSESLKQEFLTNRKKFEKMIEINPLLKDLEEVMNFDFN